MVHGGRALLIKPFGPLPYLPGCRPSHARIDIQLARGAPQKPLEAGTGVDVANWAKDGNRLTANSGAVRGDRWVECRFRFKARHSRSRRTKRSGRRRSVNGHRLHRSEDTGAARERAGPRCAQRSTAHALRTEPETLNVDTLAPAPRLLLA